MEGCGCTCTTEYLLSDASIAENIAFGMPKHLIDMNLVKEAAENLKLLDLLRVCLMDITVL